MVSVDVEGLRQAIFDLTTARTNNIGSSSELQTKVSSAGAFSTKLNYWVLGPSYGWMGDTITYLQRRLEYAELLQVVTMNGLSVVSFDDGMLASIDSANMSADVQAAVDAVRNGDAEGLAEIIRRYTITSDDCPYPFYDPIFSRAFAIAVNAQDVAGMLVGLDQDPDLDMAWYGGFLDGLAGVLSTGAQQMTWTELDRFITDWTSVQNGSIQTIPPDQILGPVAPPPPMWTAYDPNIQALSLLVARGDWPNQFLTRVTNAYHSQEGDLGVDYWLGQGVSVRDPALIDPGTGDPIRVCDPMYGVWQAAVNNPDWFTTTYATGSAMIEYITGGRNDPLDMYDTGMTEVYAGLNDVFHRGFDQASYTALMSALATVDFQSIVAGQEPVMLAQAQFIARAMLLEEYRIPTLPPWLHTALDVLSLVPVVEFAADGLNSLLYWMEGDNLNAGISAACVFIPGIAELPAKGLKWLRTIFKIGSNIPGPKVWDLIKATDNLYTGTHIPQSFTLDLGNGTSIWVNPSGSKHINEYITGGRLSVFDSQPIAEQTMLLSLREAARLATQDGIKYDELLNYGGWEFIFYPTAKSW